MRVSYCIGTVMNSYIVDRFDSSEDEIAHYREKHRQALEMLTDTRAELGKIDGIIVRKDKLFVDNFYRGVPTVIQRARGRDGTRAGR